MTNLSTSFWSFWLLFYSTSATLAKEVKAEYNKGGAVDLAARDDVHLCALLLKARRAEPPHAKPVARRAPLRAATQGTRSAPLFSPSGSAWRGVATAT